MDFDKIVFDLIDEFKFLYFPEEWNDIFFDYSKSEIFVILYLLKNEESNMSGIAEYIKVPLNTATGIVNRLVKKGLLKRVQNAEDRRIVLIKLTDKAYNLVNEEKKLIKMYFEKIYSELTEEEIKTALNIFSKVRSIFRNRESLKQDVKSNKIRKIVIE
jgi:DNA-binding MarR family transcriptional regulator